MRVVIIGGGVIGALVAWRLKRMGAEPVIVERGDWGRESSWAGAGILAPIQPWLYPDAFTVLANASLALYPRFVAELEEASGMAVEWRTTGMLVPFFPGDADEAEAALRWSARAGWRAVRLSAHEARAEVPHLAADLMHAVLWPEVGQVRNPRLLAAAKKALLRLGVVVHEHTEAVALLRQGDAVCGVRTSDGEIAADAVVLAAGAWSGELAQRWGLRLEVEPVKGEIVLLHGKPDDLRRIVKHADVYAVPRKDGRILIGATMQRVGFDRRTTEEARRALLAAVRRVLPGLLTLPIERQWTGFRPGSPDGLPYIGPVEDHPGLWVATGHYRNGVLLAPITAEVLARWILGEPPEIPMAAFSPMRTPMVSSTIGYPEERLE